MDPVLYRPVDHQPTLGAASLDGDRCRFRVWAPLAQQVDVHILGPEERWETLVRDESGYDQSGYHQSGYHQSGYHQSGYHEVTLEGISPGTRYFYCLDGAKERPDPASHHQPEGVHGPSQVTGPNFPWNDQTWPGVLLKDYIAYELHVGAFTKEGTFDAIVPYLDDLKSLGITAVELMPVAQFPGDRNWGYDGVGLFAAQNSYGGPEGLKRLVDACHQRGLAVILDVVYNHLGPEGNHLSEFGPYFTDRYHTPWGRALNFDGADSDEVRRFFIENALYWITECHIDALRLDAVHAILDHSPRTFLEELVTAVQEEAQRLNRRIYLIAESAANDVRLLHSQDSGGVGADAQWSDDFHHCLHTLLTGERKGYYQDFGQVHHLARAIREGFVYSGDYSTYRRHKHGTSSRSIPAHRFVVCAQNHDQVGNRMLGERLSQLVSFEALKLSAGVLLLSPFVPLLFMGEEYGETAPFPYFISHSDPELVEAVRRGRQAEFAAFQQDGEPPDPQEEATFNSARLDHELRRLEPHGTMRELYQELIWARKTVPALANLTKEDLEVLGYENPPALFLRRWRDQSQVAAVFNFGAGPASTVVPLPPGVWHKLVDSAEERWRGPGSQTPSALTSEGTVTFNLTAQSFILLERSNTQ